MKYLNMLKENFFGFKNFVPWSRDLPHPIAYIILNPNLREFAVGILD